MDAERRKAELEELITTDGFENLEQLLEAVLFDSVCPASCINPDCSFTTGM